MANDTLPPLGTTLVNKLERARESKNCISWQLSRDRVLPDGSVEEKRQRKKHFS